MKYSLLIYLFLFLSCSEDKIEKRQVVAIPDVNGESNLLAVSQHISLTKRPKETFQFPIQIGQVGPKKSLYAGPNQYPFYCMTIEAKLGQPLVDNQEGYGVRVYDSEGKKVGYSKDCLVKTRIDYYYITADTLKVRGFDINQPPKLRDINHIMINKQSIPEIYRLERGSINRYIYSIMMLADMTELGNRLDKKLWNQKLIYQFKGGASIGFRQGGESPQKLIGDRRDIASLGYAVVTSTGNKTAYGYKLLLAEDTARRVKRQFISLYGEPLYTLGIGGSGGALAQYIIAQNSQGILDGLMPLYSYPDMVSQSIYLLDCDLLHHYFNVSDRGDKQWLDWEQRERIEGMNGINGFTYPFRIIQPINQILAGVSPKMPNGASECVRSWFIASTFFYNPHQGFVDPYFSPSVQAQTQWTHWNDVINIYGYDKKGFARTTWGNEGVEYGLIPLKTGQLSIEEFLQINHEVGSWKPQHLMEPEFTLPLPTTNYPLWLSLWSRHNITDATEDTAAQRKSTDSIAVARGYRYGQIFVGKAELPILELRHYLDDELDMHHTSASIATRMRIEQFQGHSLNHILWVTRKEHTPILEGIALLDEWLMTMKKQPEKNLLAAKPKQLVDSCFNQHGETLSAGRGVWNGVWNNKPSGACVKYYPVLSNSRIQAGGPWSGSVFKCSLISVDDAINTQHYGNIDMKPYQQELEQIFPTGVCNYVEGDAARPQLGLVPQLTLDKLNQIPKSLPDTLKTLKKSRTEEGMLGKLSHENATKD